MNNALLIEVVQRYIDERLGDAFQELGFFTSQHRLADAVNLAGHAKQPNGKRFDH